MSYLPQSSSQWWALAQFEAGGFLGWVTHPILWVVAGPFRWASLLAMTAAQEAGYNATASGDGGASVGIAQFNVNSWPELTGRDLADRESPFLSGYYSARYVHVALLTSWSWFAVALPFIGPAFLRFMWTHGVSASSAEKAWSEAYDAYSIEGRASGAWWTFRALSIVPAVLATGAAYALGKRMARGGFRVAKVPK